MNLLTKTLYTTNLILFLHIQANTNLDAVDHKNSNLKLYLDAIQYNLQEKIGIFPYILETKQGNYLEIGTGGDPIAELMRNIPNDFNVQIIASDIDQHVLDSLITRHPELNSYINATKGVQLKLKQLNAIDMSIFPDNYLNGINASSVVHEIVSYAGGQLGFQKFFQEAHRVLKQDGILIYRDPEFVSNDQSIVTISLKNKIAKLFNHIFLYKFLDFRGSQLAKENRKMFLYNTEDIKFHVYKKHETFISSYSYEEYLHIPSYDIDFSRKYSITLPYGLYRELSRHYLTYLHICNPLMYLKIIPDITQESYFINYWAHSTNEVLKNFLGQHSNRLKNEHITAQQKNSIEKEIEKNCQVLEFGIPLKFVSKQKEFMLRKLLQDNNFNPSSHLIAIDKNISLLDYRIFGMFYNQIQPLLDNQNKIERADDEKHAIWLKREGEEYYCYLSVDAIITQVFLLSLEASKKAYTNIEDITVLCPIDHDHNKFLNRWCYSELLKETFDVYDCMDYPIEVFDGKRIIHFKKMRLKDAIMVCENIIKTEPSTYQALANMIHTLKKE